MRIPHTRHRVSEKDIKAIGNTVEWGVRLTDGFMVRAFEKQLAAFAGATYVHCVSSGTAALHIAYLGMKGLYRAKRVLTTANTFIATASMARAAGLEVEFVDVDENGMMRLDEVEERLLQEPRIDILTVVHFAGRLVNMDRVADLKSKYKLVVLEDSAHSMTKSPVSDSAIFSFHPSKHITSAEGGAFLTDHFKLYEHAGAYAYPKNFEVVTFNYRMSELHAALGISQLATFEERRKERNRLADLYRKNLEGIPNLHVPPAFDNPHLFQVYTTDRHRVVKALSGAGVMEVPTHYTPCTMAAWATLQRPMLGSIDHLKTSISLPFYCGMSDDEVLHVCKAIREALK